MHAIERSTVELIVPRHTYITQRKSTIAKKLLCANITTFAIASQTNLPCMLLLCHLLEIQILLGFFGTPEPSGGQHFISQSHLRRLCCIGPRDAICFL